MGTLADVGRVDDGAVDELVGRLGVSGEYVERVDQRDVG